MTKTSLPPPPTPPGSPEENAAATTDFTSGAGKNRYAQHVVNIERRSHDNTVFHIDDHTFPSSMPKASHWSVAWSDLMMTMFVLFLSMFAYQSAHQEFLQKKKPEIIGGDTTEALQTVDSSGAALPFVPIHPGLPVITGGTVKKVEKTQLEPLEPASESPTEPAAQVDKPAPQEEPAALQPEKTAKVDDAEEGGPPQMADSPATAPAKTPQEPGPPDTKAEQATATDQFQEIYTLSKGALESNNLDKFAAIDIVPDKTMRIILTGDLLFDVGASELSADAKSSLHKVVAVMQRTPYMINVVGHTDNLPMRSNRFKSNWELSVARASTVARFLIDDMGMNPSQFVVSGYSSYRPVVPNTTAENRAINRRVEIIISKRLPNPLPATPHNLK